MALTNKISEDWPEFRDLREPFKRDDKIIVVRDDVSYKAEADDFITSGWGNYSDTQYTSGSPFSISANTDTVIPNNRGSVLEGEVPRDVGTFYDGSVITGRSGDSISITVDLKLLPTSRSTTIAEFWFDIGGSVGEIYRRIVTFPKGDGVARPVDFTIAGYTLGTWEANGATVYVRTNGTAGMYDIRYVIHRNHRAWG